jgi:hypothetical protein
VSPALMGHLLNVLYDMTTSPPDRSIENSLLLLICTLYLRPISTIPYCCAVRSPLVRDALRPGERANDALYVDVLAVPNLSTPYACLLCLVPVSAGYPSPADDYLDGSLDLNQHLIKHPTATFFVRVAGESMREAGIHSGDVLIEA